MVTRRVMMVVLLAGSMAFGGALPADAQCCFQGLFAGCQSCFRQAPPAYAVAPVYAPIPAPVPVPPPPPQPVMVPVQQVSYVPETTYQTKYECVPVTSYKPSCEIDPCTGCPVECMQPVTSYQQRPVSVPVTQYRAVYSTKYVQMQPGAAPAAYPAMTGAPAASPFSAPVQTSPQAWAAAGADVPTQLTPPPAPAPQIVPGQSGFTAPTLPPAAAPQSTFRQQVVPQNGTYATPAPQTQLQPTSPPTLTPPPSLRPIPDLPRTAPANGPKEGAAATTDGQQPAATTNGPQQQSAPPLTPIHPSAAPAQGGGAGVIGMPVLPGQGPGPATGAFPKLLEPTGHTTQARPFGTTTSARAPSQPPTTVWQAAVPAPAAEAYASGAFRGGYPTAALPIRAQQ